MNTFIESKLHPFQFIMFLILCPNTLTVLCVFTYVRIGHHI